MVDVNILRGARENAMRRAAVGLEIEGESQVAYLNFEDSSSDNLITYYLTVWS
jgi:hypothetical protein